MRLPTANFRKVVIFNLFVCQNFISNFFIHSTVLLKNDQHGKKDRRIDLRIEEQTKMNFERTPRSIVKLLIDINPCL